MFDGIFSVRPKLILAHLDSSRAHSFESLGFESPQPSLDTVNKLLFIEIKVLRETISLQFTTYKSICLTRILQMLS